MWCQVQMFMANFFASAIIHPHLFSASEKLKLDKLKELIFNGKKRVCIQQGYQHRQKKKKNPIRYDVLNDKYTIQHA